MKTKFTPGPWQFYADLPSVEPNWHIVTSANRMRVVANVHIEPDNATDEANVHLISAAPDLYEALSDLVPIFERMGELHPSRDLRVVLPDPAGLAVRIRIALSKARGES